MLYVEASILKTVIACVCFICFSVWQLVDALPEIKHRQVTTLPPYEAQPVRAIDDTAGGHL